MLLDIFQSISWVEFAVILVFVRILSTAFKTGLGVEIFKTLGLVFSAFISFHYLDSMANLYRVLLNMSEPLAETLGFLTLWGLTVLIFALIRDGILTLMHADLSAKVNQWGSSILSVIRAFLVASLMLVACFLTELSYLSDNAQASLTGRYLIKLAPSVYSGMFGVVRKVFPNEDQNIKALELQR